MLNKVIPNKPIHGSDGESLSALFDGQLGSDAERFALNRLGQDAGWRDACGRWQLAGDVLRGSGSAPAPTGFADRVMAAVEQEQQHGREQVYPALAGRTIRKRGHTRPNTRWIGGALAASVAIAALFVARPMLDGEDTSADTPAGREIVSAPAGSTAAPMGVQSAGAQSIGSVSIAANSEVAADGTGPTSGASTATGALAADMAATAAAAAATGVPKRRERRRPPVTRSVASSRQQAAPATAMATLASTGSDQVAPVAASKGEVRGRPFMPDAIESKPWPRAAVAGYSADAAMTVGLHGSDHSAAPISFYPFEPSTLRGESLRSAVERGPAPNPHTLPEPSAGAAIRH